MGFMCGRDGHRPVTARRRGRATCQSLLGQRPPTRGHCVEEDSASLLFRVMWRTTTATKNPLIFFCDRNEVKKRLSTVI